MRVKRGTIYGFLGPNGSGKTTHHPHAVRAAHARPGSRHLPRAFDIITQSAQIKHYVGYMTQRFSLYQDLSVAGRIWNSSRGSTGLRDPVAAARAMIERIGLGGREQQLAGELSGGWKQRLALGACHAARPAAAPARRADGGCRPQGTTRVLGTRFTRWAGEGLTVLVSTHYMDEGPSAATRSPTSPMGICWCTVRSSR